VIKTKLIQSRLFHGSEKARQDRELEEISKAVMEKAFVLEGVSSSGALPGTSSSQVPDYRLVKLDNLPQFIKVTKERDETAEDLSATTKRMEDLEAELIDSVETRELGVKDVEDMSKLSMSLVHRLMDMEIQFGRLEWAPTDARLLRHCWAVMKERGVMPPDGYQVDLENDVLHSHATEKNSRQPDRKTLKSKPINVSVSLSVPQVARMSRQSHSVSRAARMSSQSESNSRAARTSCQSVALSRFGRMPNQVSFSLSPASPSRTHNRFENVSRLTHANGCMPNQNQDKGERQKPTSISPQQDSTCQVLFPEKLARTNVHRSISLDPTKPCSSGIEPLMKSLGSKEVATGDNMKGKRSMQCISPPHNISASRVLGNQGVMVSPCNPGDGRTIAEEWTQLNEFGSTDVATTLPNKHLDGIKLKRTSSLPDIDKCASRPSTPTVVLSPTFRTREVSIDIFQAKENFTNIDAVAKPVKSTRFAETNLVPTAMIRHKSIIQEGFHALQMSSPSANMIPSTSSTDGE